MPDFAFEDGQTVVMIGDSITDCGRRDDFAPYGNGYVRQAIDLITARYPERRIRFINEGIGGNTVLDLRNRWRDDVILRRPDWVTIKVGINDLHQFLGGADLGPSRYEALYREILDRTKAETSARIALIDPFYVSADTDGDGFASRVLTLLPEYLDVVRRLASEYGTLHVETHAAFRRQLAYRPAERFCPEPVHPNLSGHLVIAQALLGVLGW